MSVLIPMLNEEDNAVALMARFREIVAAYPDHDFELVLVDDGSTDGTVALLGEAIRPGEPVTIVQLARNFGSHYAISAGLAYVRGDCAIVLGADLQEPLSAIGDMLAAWRPRPGGEDGHGATPGSDIVWGLRRTRARVSLLGGVASRAFSALFHRYSDLKAYPPQGPSTVLCSRAVIDVVNRMPERHRNVLGLIAWSGFTQTTVEFDQLARRAGTSKWTTSKLLKLAVDSFVQFSSAPIRFFTWAGFTIAALGFLYGVALVLLALVGTAAPTGWTTVMVVILILGGFQLLMLGVLGEYLWRAADESRQRPLFIVRNVITPPGVQAAPHLALDGDSGNVGHHAVAPTDLTMPVEGPPPRVAQTAETLDRSLARRPLAR